MKNNEIEGKVLNVINDYKIVINKGKRDGVYLSQKFLVYYLSKDDIVDEDTGENLGKIEFVIGKAKVVHIQDTMATLESCEYVTVTKRTIKKSNGYLIVGNEETIVEPEEKQMKLECCKKGHLVRSLN